MEKAEQVKTASIISAEGDTEAADLLASAFAKAGEGLVSNIPTYTYSTGCRSRPKSGRLVTIYFVGSDPFTENCHRKN